jgi:glucose-fructose oxidoreductase
VTTKPKAAKVVPITAMPVLARLLHSSVPMGSRGSIRYAVVGLGHIAQVAVLPAFAHARANSKLVALVSDDADKRRTLARRYGVEHACSYDDFEQCLEHVDAVYIAVPNARHAEFTIRAAHGGAHVLCEKPMAVTVAECDAMIAACRKNRVKLMIAYRLHFEEANLDAVELVRKGRIGEPKYFTSAFSMRVRPGDVRTKPDLGGGTLYDIGVYCINAARYVFRAEPEEVAAFSVNQGGARLNGVDESTAAVLRYSGARVAAFVTSFNAADVAEYRVVGTKGHLHVDPAYEYAEGLAYSLHVNGKVTRKRLGKRDQFAPELLHFSECIQRNRQPEPSGEEGRQDVRIVQALYESAHTGVPVPLPPFHDGKRPSARQRVAKPGVKKPRLVKVKSPTL